MIIKGRPAGGVVVTRPVPGYEGLYDVSNDGRVWSHVSGKWLKAEHGTDYYYYVNLYKDGKRSHTQVSRMVASAFLPNPENLPIVNHKDESRTNDYVHVWPDGTVSKALSNLEWCTHKYNITYRNAIANRLRSTYGEDYVQLSNEEVYRRKLDYIKRWKRAKRAKARKSLYHEDT